MSIMITNDLNRSQKEKIQFIIESSKKLEPISMSFPYEDADFYILNYAKETLLAAAAFTKEDTDLFSCLAFTSPSARHHGLFSEILDAAIDELPEDTDFLFYTDGKSNDTNKVLLHLEAECIQEEYMMELSLFDFCSSALEKCIPITVQETESIEEHTPTLFFETPYGHVSISVFSSYYYLYGFEITENFRGKGHGFQMLIHILEILKEKNPLPIRLQVSGNNLPALSLYQKTGFRVTETLFCYLY